MFSARHAVTILLAALTVAAGSACAVRDRDATSRSEAIVLVDDFGDTLRLVGPARRIVSLNPVSTEALFTMGAGGRVVGRTHFDGYPAAVREVADVGNGMQPNVEAVLAVHPDLVVLYASNANRPAAAALRRAGVATLAMHADRVADFAAMMRRLGVVTGDSIRARAVADSVNASLDAVRALPRTGDEPVIFWHLWDAPIITIGAGSFLAELVEVAGARNAFGDLTAPSPQVTLESVAARAPRYILTGPRSASRLRADARWRAIAAVREGRILVPDTALVGRPGVRMGEAARHLRALLDSAEARP